MKRIRNKKNMFKEEWVVIKNKEIWKKREGINMRRRKMKKK